MRYRFIQGLILLIGLFTGCQQIKSTDETEELKKVLFNYFDGIKNKDFKKITEATTDDFILYEMGRVWNNDSVFHNIKENLPFTVEYKLDNFKITVDIMSGHMNYYNQGTFTFNDSTKQSFSWIESASFKKGKEGWKMSFLHITERYEAGKQ